MEPVRGGARRPRRRSAWRCWRPRFSLVVIFVPVSFMSSDLGPLPLPVRHHRGGGGAGVSLLVSFTLTPMMSARLLRAEDAAARRRGGRQRRLPARLLRRASTRGYTWIARAGRCATARSSWSSSRGRHRSSVPLYRLVQAGVHPERRGRGGVRRQRHRARGHEPGRDGRGDAAPSRRRSAAIPGVRLVLASAGGGFLGGVNQGGVYVRIAPHEERTFSSAALWREHRCAASRSPPSGATTASGT